LRERKGILPCLFQLLVVLNILWLGTASMQEIVIGHLPCTNHSTGHWGRTEMKTRSCRRNSKAVCEKAVQA
jgi:hypothetical protein